MSSFRLQLSFRLGASLLLAALAGGCSYTVRESMLFLPRRAAMLSDRIQRQNLVIPFEGGTLKGWHLTHPEARVNLLYFGGNGESLVRSIARLYALAETFRANVICVDPRGYGASDGTPGLAFLQEDALRMYDATATRRESLPTVAVSFSIGTWSAVHLAAHRPLDGLVLIAPFSSYEDIAPAYKRQGPWWSRLVAPFVLLRPDAAMLKVTQPLQAMDRVRTTLLVVQGEKDRVMPLACGRHMHDRAGSTRKSLLVVPGADHNDLAPAAEPIRSALEEVLARAGARP